jgi:chromosome segregation ATPase
MDKSDEKNGCVCQLYLNIILTDSQRKLINIRRKGSDTLSEYSFTDDNGYLYYHMRDIIDNGYQSMGWTARGLKDIIHIFEDYYDVTNATKDILITKFLTEATPQGVFVDDNCGSIMKNYCKQEKINPEVCRSSHSDTQAYMVCILDLHRKTYNPTGDILKNLETCMRQNAMNDQTRLSTNQVLIQTQNTLKNKTIECEGYIHRFNEQDFLLTQYNKTLNDLHLEKVSIEQKHSTSNQQLNDSMTTLQQQLHEQTQQHRKLVQDHDDQNKQGNVYIQSLTKRINGQDQENSRLQNQLTGLPRLQESCDRKTNIFQDTIEKLNRRIADNSTQLLNQGIRITEEKKEIATQLEQTKQELEECHTYLNSSNLELTKEKKIAHSLNNEIKGLKDLVETLEYTAHSSGQDSKTIQTSLNECTNRVTQLQIIQEENKKNILELTAQVRGRHHDKELISTLSTHINSVREYFYITPPVNLDNHLDIIKSFLEGFTDEVGKKIDERYQVLRSQDQTLSAKENKESLNNLTNSVYQEQQLFISTIDSLKMSVNALEEELYNKNKDLSTLQEQYSQGNQALQYSYGQLQGQYENARESLQLYQTTIDKYERQISQYKIDVEQQTSLHAQKLQQHQNECEGKLTRIAKQYEERLGQTGEELKKSGEELKKSGEELKKSGEELKKSGEELKKSGEELKKSREDYNNLSRRNNLADKDLNICKTSLKDCESTVNSQIDQINSLLTEKNIDMNNLKVCQTLNTNQRNQSGEKLSQMTKELNTYVNDRGVLTRKIENHTSEVNEMRVLLLKCRKEKDDLGLKLVSAINTRDEERTKNSIQCTNLNTNYKRRLHIDGEKLKDLQVQLNKSNSRIENITNRENALQQLHNECKSRIKELETELDNEWDAGIDNVHKIESSLIKEKKEKLIIIQELHKIKRTKAELEDKYTRQSNSLKDKDRVIAELLADKARVTHDLAETLEEKNELISALGVKSDSIAIIKKGLESLQVMHDTKLKDLNTCSNDLDTAKKEKTVIQDDLENVLSYLEYLYTLYNNLTESVKVHVNNLNMTMGIEGVEIGGLSEIVSNRVKNIDNKIHDLELKISTANDHIGLLEGINKQSLETCHMTNTELQAFLDTTSDTVKVLDDEGGIEEKKYKNDINDSIDESLRDSVFLLSKHRNVKDPEIPHLTLILKLETLAGHNKELLRHQQNQRLDLKGIIAKNNRLTRRLNKYEPVANSIPSYPNWIKPSYAVNDDMILKPIVLSNQKQDIFKKGEMPPRKTTTIGKLLDRLDDCHSLNKELINIVNKEMANIDIQGSSYTIIKTDELYGLKSELKKCQNGNYKNIIYDTYKPAQRIKVEEINKRKIAFKDKKKLSPPELSKHNQTPAGGSDSGGSDDIFSGEIVFDFPPSDSDTE